MVKIVRSLSVAVLLSVVLSGCAAMTERAVSPAAVATPTVLITGASRGIGFELARQYAERGWGVIATCRTPSAANELQAVAARLPNLVIEPLDVTDFAEMDRLAVRYAGVPIDVLDYAMVDSLAEKLRGQSIDILINNAGIRGPRDQQSFGALNYASFEPVMATNTLAPLKMAEAFIDHVAASEQKKIITISSSLGSISQTFGGSYFYRASKTAVNMMMANLAADVRDREVIVGLVTPGYVDTDFTRGAGDQIPKISPAESAAGMLPVIDDFSLDTTGTLMRHTGEPLAW